LLQVKQSFAGEFQAEFVVRATPECLRKICTYPQEPGKIRAGVSQKVLVIFPGFGTVFRLPAGLRENNEVKSGGWIHCIG
jgi:hypothetical protein